MAKKLDNLLESIAGKGGFRDASITFQTKYVAELEEGICALSGKCRMWRVCSPYKYIILIAKMLFDCSCDLSSRFAHSPVLLFDFSK